MGRLRALRTWIRLIRNGLDLGSALRIRRGDYGDIRFRGRRIEGPDPPRLAWMATHIWGGEYDLPGFLPRRGDRVADLGANVGVFSVLAAARGAHVTAVEPHPATFERLRRNTGSWDVDCRHAAVVGAVPPSGTVELVEDPRGDTAHHLVGTQDGGPRTGSVRVPAIALVDLLAENYDLIKLDVEGAEFEILEQTPPETLARLRRLVLEVHRRAGDPERVRQLLENAGLDVAVTDISDDGAHLLMTAQVAAA